MPEWKPEILRRLAPLKLAPTREAEIAEEIAQHLEDRYQELLATGQSEDAAYRTAFDELKDEDLLARSLQRVEKNFYREPIVPGKASSNFFADILQDIRYALRMLRKSPGFTAVAILTLALGIGANTAIFSLLDGLVLRDLPVPHPEQLVHFGAHAPSDDYALVSLPMFEEITRDQKVFSSTFAWWGDGVFNVETDGELSRADIWAVTGNFYSELGATPEIGRLIVPADVNLNAASPVQVAVLGYEFWQRYYGGRRDALGKTLKIEGVPFTIVGVARKRFKGMDADTEPEVTVPLTAEPLIAGDKDVQKALQGRDNLWIDAGGRLKPGVTLGQARAQLESLWPAIRNAVMPVQLTTNERSFFDSLQLKLESFATGNSFLRGEFTKPVYVLLAISGIVLLIACVNLASLMLSRAAVRSHEFGVRVALGASPARLAKQMLTESVMLSVAGTIAGFGLAQWGSRAFAAFIFRQYYGTFNIPGGLNLSPDLRALSFTAAIALLTGIFFGLAPAWRAAREDPNSSLQQGARTLGRGTGRLGRALIVTQIALSLVLLSGASLFIRTLEKLRTVQPGFQIGGVIQVDLFPKPNAFKNADRVSYFHHLTERVSLLPGVASAGMEHMEVGGGAEWTEKIHIRGQNTGDFSTDFGMVMPGFFRTENITLLRGRSFLWSDDAKAPRVAIVSENFAQMAFSRGNAVGQHIDITTEPKWQNLEIVGVVSNASLYDIRKPRQPTVYLPTTQYGDWADDDQLLVRTNLPLATTLLAIRSVLDSVGRESILSANQLSQTVTRSLLQERITAMLSAFFGALALLIAGIGLFGLMAYNVTRRTRELGIRFALGAQRSSVLGMILRETLALTLIGVAIGLPCALIATRLIAHMLFGVKPYDPITLAAVTIALLAVAALAGYIPARRAMRVDPMVALRYE